MSPLAPLAMGPPVGGGAHGEQYTVRIRRFAQTTIMSDILTQRAVQVSGSPYGLRAGVQECTGSPQAGVLEYRISLGAGVLENQIS